MQFTSETRLETVLERTFIIGDIPGILWAPHTASPQAPTPLILMGAPGDIQRMHPRLLQRALRSAQSGFASATIELPGGGEREPIAELEQARADLREALSAGRSVTEIVDRLVLPLVDRAVPEWQSTLDALLELAEIGGPVGYSGGIISIAIRLARVEARIVAAGLFAGTFVPQSLVDEARHISIPLHMLLQWDDQTNDRQKALELFDAFGSPEKTLQANLGGHLGVPAHAGEDSARFFERHLR